MKVIKQFPNVSLGDIAESMFIEHIPHVTAKDILNSEVDDSYIVQTDEWLQTVSNYESDTRVSKRGGQAMKDYFKILIVGEKKEKKLTKEYDRRKMSKLVAKKCKRNRSNKYSDRTF